MVKIFLSFNNNLYICFSNLKQPLLYEKPFHFLFNPSVINT